tara:strand:+ start:1416 stop:2294 length:879 start_codon:yes stop_codon:yes gene_type:complete
MKEDTDISEYWKDRFRQDKKNFSKFLGFGGFKYRKNYNFAYLIVLNLIHLIYQKFTYKNFNYIFSSKEYLVTKIFCKKMKIPLNWRILRHTFIFHYLKKFIKDKKNFAVIGDGFATFSGILYLIKKSKFKIYIINLSQVNRLDKKLLIEKLGVDKKKIQYAKSKNDIKNFCKSKKNFCFVDSKNKMILKNTNIEIFFNTFSFCEMNNEVIKEYFKIIKSCKSYIYSCNSDKIWNFSNKFKVNIPQEKYPWKNYKNIFFKKCFWVNKIYFIGKSLTGEKYDKKDIYHILKKAN